MTTKSLVKSGGGEVAGVALDPFRLIGKTLGDDEEILFEGMPHLLAGPKRFDWTDICVLYERTEKLSAGRMTFEEIGHLGIEAPKFKQILAAAAAVASPMLLYSLGNRFGLRKTFSHLQVDQRELPNGHLVVEIAIPQTHDHSEGFFRITRGVLQALPKLLGMKPARVDLEIEARRGVYTVHVPQSQTIAARFKRGVRAMLAGQHALEQLNEQQAELNEQYEKLSAAYVEVQAALEVKRRFMSIMSHELRTPLNGIIGASAALRYEKDGSVRADLHDALDYSASSLARLVDGVLELSRSDGRVDAVEVEVDLPVLFDEVTADAKTVCEEKGLAFSANLDASALGRFSCDGPRFAQVLEQLLDNAAKFTTHGRVVIDVRFEDDQLQAVVTDTGTGIPEDHHDTIFELFKQLDDGSTREFGGAGLGLALVKRQIDVMNGVIDVSSKVGAGTSMTVRIPAKLVAARVQENVAPVVSTRVLVVDDNRVNRLVVARMLKKLEWEVHEAADGAEAVDLAQKMDFAAILMDCEMPVMNGWDATTKIRSLRSDPPPIIAVTAYVSDEDRERCREAGMCDFLPKPVKPVDIERTLARWTLEPQQAA